MTPGELQVLATYRAEQGRGLVHTPAWRAQMGQLQAKLDASRNPQNGASIGPLSTPPQEKP